LFSGTSECFKREASLNEARQFLIGLIKEPKSSATVI
jgi:hypothetical protein